LIKVSHVGFKSPPFKTLKGKKKRDKVRLKRGKKKKGIKEDGAGAYQRYDWHCSAFKTQFIFILKALFT
jgi:hypothetical protein